MGTKSISISVLVLLALFSSAIFASPLNLVEKTRTIKCGETLLRDTSLKADLFCSNNSLVLNASGMTLDCQGHKIMPLFAQQNSTSTGFGLIISNKENITVKNCLISRFGYGIYLDNTTASRFYNNSFNNTINAYETVSSTGNQWDYGGVGNSWSDFPQNPGYPEIGYIIPGPGDGVDHFPPGLLRPLACGNLTEAGRTYNMTQTLQINGSTCFSITAPNVTLDCNGYSISGSNSPNTYGIYSDQSGTAVKNCVISNFNTGIFSSGATSAISDNVLAAPSASGTGIAVHGTNSTICRNSISSGNISLGIYGSDGVYENNTVSSSLSNFIYANNSQRNIIKNNRFNATMRLCNFQNSIIANNTINSGSSSGIAQASAGCSLASNLIFNNSISTTSGTAIRFLSANAQNNTLYWNNITAATGLYVNDSSGQNSYNTTMGGHGEGNIYANVMSGSVRLTGTLNSLYGEGLYIGSDEYGYPYGNENSQGKFSCLGGCLDHAPLTPTKKLLCGNLTEAGATYNMTQTLRINGSTCFFVQAQNVTLNCGSCPGCIIIGNNSPNTYGIYSDQPGTVVKNCSFTLFPVGIYFNGSTDGTIFNNFINVDNTAGDSAILLTNNAHRNNLSRNQIDSSGSGIYIDGGENTSVNCQGQLISGDSAPGTYGIYSSQPGTTIRNCLINGVSIGIFSSGERSAIWDNNMLTASSNTGIAVHGSNSTIYRNILTFSSGVSIGIYGSDGVYENNTVSSSLSNFIYANNSQRNIIKNNRFNATMRLCNFQNSIIANNTINSGSSNSIAQASAGCSLASNLIFNNSISTTSGTAIRFLSANAQNNTLYWNNITAATGLYVNDSSGQNSYNTTMGGHGEGNIYANVMSGSVPISGTVSSLYGSGLYTGSSGSGYPYSNATSQGKFLCTGECADYAPLTPTLMAPPILCGDTISQSITLSNDITCLEGQWVALTAAADNITINCAGRTITGSPGIDDWGINILGRSSITIKNCIFRGLNFPIYHEDGSNNVFENNIFNGTRHGPILRKGSNNRIVNNTILGSEMDGIGVIGYLNDGIPSINNIVSNNTLLSCGSDYASIDLSYAHNTLVEGNHIIGTGQYDNSIIMVNAVSFNNTIKDNHGTNGDYGFWVTTGSSNNTFIGNYISNSGYVGIYIDSETSGNRMSNNTVFSSAQNNAYQESAANLNDWEINGFGNYWGDHNCIDIAAPIGICDNPYNFPGDTDYSPLANSTWPLSRESRQEIKQIAAKRTK